MEKLTQEIRTTSYLLHPPLLDESGIAAALRWYVEGLEKHSPLQIELQISDELGRLPREMELVLFRIVQECLTNVLMHSASDKAEIRLYREGDEVKLRAAITGREPRRRNWRGTVTVAETESGCRACGIGCGNGMA